MLLRPHFDRYRAQLLQQTDELLAERIAHRIGQHINSIFKKLLVQRLDPVFFGTGHRVPA